MTIVNKKYDKNVWKMYIESIFETLNRLLKHKKYYSFYKSSEIRLCDKNCKRKYLLGSNKFYIDLTDKETMCSEKNY